MSILDLMYPSISAIIPLHNKSSEIKHTLESLFHYFTIKNLDYEIIIVENGSIDNSKLITEEFIKNHKNMYLFESEKGLGKALKFGIEKSTKEVIWFVPADFLFETSDINYYLTHDIYPQFSICSRAHPESKVNRAINRRLISYIYFLIYKTVLGLNIRDLQGAFIGEALSIKKVTKTVKSDNFFFQTELISRYIKINSSYTEIPVSVYESETNKTTIKFFRDIFRFIRDLFNYKLDK